MKKILLIVFILSTLCSLPVSADDSLPEYYNDLYISTDYPAYSYDLSLEDLYNLPYFHSLTSSSSSMEYLNLCDTVLLFTWYHNQDLYNDNFNYIVGFRDNLTNCYWDFNDKKMYFDTNSSIISNGGNSTSNFANRSSISFSTLLYTPFVYVLKGDFVCDGYSLYNPPASSIKYNPYRLSAELYDRFSGTYTFGSQPYDYFVTDYIMKATSVATDKDRFSDLDSTHVLSADSKFNFTTTYRIPSYHQCYLYYQEFVQSGSLDSSHPETIQRQLLDYAHSHPMPSYFVFPLRSFTHVYNYDLFVKAYTTTEPSYYSLNKTGHPYAFTDGIFLFEDLRDSLDTTNSEYNIYTLALQLYFSQPQYVTVTREDPLTISSPFTFYFDYTLTTQQQNDILNNIATGDIHYSPNGSIYGGGGRRDPDSPEVDTVDTQSLDSLANSIVVPIDNDTYNSSVLTFLDILFSSIPSQIWSVLFFGLGTLVVIFALKVLWG